MLEERPHDEKGQVPWNALRIGIEKKAKEQEKKKIKRICPTLRFAPSCPPSLVGAQVWTPGPQTL